MNENVAGCLTKRSIITAEHGRYFQEIVRARRSIRAFMPERVPAAVINKVLADAQLSPSNANTQPWNVHVVSGEKRKSLTRALLSAVTSGKFSPDYSYAAHDYAGVYAERMSEQARLHAEEFGIARDDTEGRMRLTMKNFELFNAPHVALLFMPKVGDCVRVAADVGMYGQSFLLSLTAHGLAGVPQTSIGMVADEVRAVLGLPGDMTLLFAISFGYPADEQLDKRPMPRVGIHESVKFHE